MDNPIGIMESGKVLARGASSNRVGGAKLKDFEERLAISNSLP